jgi:hypothetical protein
MTRLRPGLYQAGTSGGAGAVVPLGVAIGEEVIHLSLQWKPLLQSSRL